MDTKLEQCILSLIKIDVVKFGNFTLKSGIQSPIYFDLRQILSFPSILETVSDLLWESVYKKYDIICGVPYTALPIATVMSIKNNVPMLMRRKERKGYGTKKLIEGNYSEGQSCLIIEDVIVSGSSILETADLLREESLVVTDAIVFLDREQGGCINLKQHNINVTSVITVTQVLNIISKHNIIDDETLNKTRNFLKENLVPLKDGVNEVLLTDQQTEPVSKRIVNEVCPLVKKIMDVVKIKKSNLCVAADVQSTIELLHLADDVGPHICMLKTHIDILNDFTPETTKKLKDLSVKHNFLLFEDRKFGDIGNTCRMQYSDGIYNIKDWADLVTVHGTPGPGVITGLSSCLDENSQNGFIIIAEMSSEGTLTDAEYIKGCVKLAEQFPNRVVGFVTQTNIVNNSNFLQLTPGISLKDTKDALGQQYNTPENAVLNKCADIIIVGRGITSAKDRISMAKKYQERGFNALMKRCDGHF